MLDLNVKNDKVYIMQLNSWSALNKRHVFFVNGRQTQLFWKWKMTSITLKMEDNLNYFVIGRRPQLFCNWKMTSIIFQMKDNLNFFIDGRRHSF